MYTKKVYHLHMAINTQILYNYLIEKYFKIYTQYKKSILMKKIKLFDPVIGTSEAKIISKVLKASIDLIVKYARILSCTIV